MAHLIRTAAVWMTGPIGHNGADGISRPAARSDQVVLGVSPADCAAGALGRGARDHRGRTAGRLGP